MFVFEIAFSEASLRTGCSPQSRSLERNSLQNKRSWANLLSAIFQQVSPFNTSGCPLLNLEMDSSSFKILLQERQEMKHQFWAQCPPDGKRSAHMLWALHSVGLCVCSRGSSELPRSDGCQSLKLSSLKAQSTGSASLLNIETLENAVRCPRFPVSHSSHSRYPRLVEWIHVIISLL